MANRKQSRPRERPATGAQARSPWPVLLGLVLFSLALNANNLGNALVYDDNEAIIKNEAAHGLRNTVRIFTTPSWWSQSEDYVRHYRPLTTWTYALNYSLHGLDPGGYHLVNNALHGVAAWLVFLVLTAGGVGFTPALIAALLFLTHPVHVEAVAWVNCRADILAGLFVLLSLYLHIQSCRTAPSDRSGRLLIAGSLLSFALAGLAKETGYMTPFVLLAWDACIGARQRAGVVVTQELQGNQQTETPARFRWHVTEYALHALVLASFLLIRQHFVGGAAEATITKMNSPLGDAPHVERVLTACYVLARYFWILLFPYELSVDYSPDAITRVVSLADPRALIGVGAAAAYLLLMLFAMKRNRVVAFPLLLAAIVFAPASNIPFAIGTIMAERLMYLPALAVCVPLAFAITRLERPRSRVTMLACAAVVIGLYSARTYVRNEDWRSEESIFRAAIEVVPRSAMANKNLGGALHNSGRHEQAIPYYEKAIQILYEFPNAHSELANCLFSKKEPDYEGAVKEYQLALKMTNGRHATARMNLGATYHLLKRHEEALAETDAAIQLNSNLDRAWFNRVHMLVELGRAQDAKRRLDEAVRRFPQHQQEAEARQKVESALRP